MGFSKGGKTTACQDLFLKNAFLPRVSRLRLDSPVRPFPQSHEPSRRDPKHPLPSQEKCRATACIRFSTFLLNPFVSLVNRRIHILMVYFSDHFFSKSLGDGLLGQWPHQLVTSIVGNQTIHGQFLLHRAAFRQCRIVVEIDGTASCSVIF